jgi:hypothetical protein
MSEKRLKRYFLFVVLFLSVFIFAVFSLAGVWGATQISSCQDITSPGVYELSGNIVTTTGQDCIRIKTSNVIIDGKGYTIKQNNLLSGYSGIISYSLGADPKYYGNTNLSIKNVIIQDFWFGIWLNRVNNSMVLNSTIYLPASIGISESSQGIYMLSSSYNSIKNNIVKRASGSELVLNGGSYNNITNNRFIADNYSSGSPPTIKISFHGIDMTNSIGNIISKNTACNHYSQDVVCANTTSPGSINNLGTGNLFGRVASCSIPGGSGWPNSTDYKLCSGGDDGFLCSDSSMCSGCCNMTSHLCTSSPGYCNSLPHLITSCQVITTPGVYELANDLSYVESYGPMPSSGRCIDIMSDNVTINGNGHLIINTLPESGGNTTQASGILTSGSYKNITIKNTIIKNFQNGMSLRISNSSIINNSIQGYIKMSNSLPSSGLTLSGGQNVIKDNVISNVFKGISSTGLNYAIIQGNRISEGNSQGTTVFGNIGIYLYDSFGDNLSDNSACGYRDYDFYCKRTFPGKAVVYYGSNNFFSKIFPCPAPGNVWPSSSDYSICLVEGVVEKGEPVSCGDFDSKTACEDSDLLTDNILSNVQDFTGLGGDFCFGETTTTSLGCEVNVNCNCKWDDVNNICDGSFEISPVSLSDPLCNGLSPSGDGCKISYNYSGAVDCNSQDEYVLSWTSKWKDTGVENVSMGCISGSTAIACPEKSNLPFFGVFNFIISGLLIAGVYLFLKKK